MEGDRLPKQVMKLYLIGRKKKKGTSKMSGFFWNDERKGTFLIGLQRERERERDKERENWRQKIIGLI